MNIKIKIKQVKCTVVMSYDITIKMVIMKL